MASLLEVPRYADLVDDDEVSEPGSVEVHTGSPPTRHVLINSKHTWRQELVKWAEKSITDAVSEEKRLPGGTTTPVDKKCDGRPRVRMYDRRGAVYFV